MIYGFVSSTTFIDVLSKDPSHKTFLQHPKLYGSMILLEIKSNNLEDFAFLGTIYFQGPKLVWWLYDHGSVISVNFKVFKSASSVRSRFWSLTIG
ncbi:hypothetical protein P8452_66203 [Trifolium repens]|nr:hypothetical protein P8452_66203 [Trifolium repens]